jgi:hypothetical protein
MIYDDLNKKWVPSGSSHGLSKVHIYHHFLNNTFRVVGRKLQDHEVSLILKANVVLVIKASKCILSCEFFVFRTKIYLHAQN